MPIHESFIDSNHCDLFKINHREKHRMSKQSFTYWISARSRISHCRYYLHILNLFKDFFFLFVIIPSSIIKELSHQFERRLGTILFNLWHIYVINEYYTFHSIRSSITSSTFSIQFRLDNFLHLILMSLGTETEIHTNKVISGQRFDIS